jgi:hypothetical protein
MGVKQLEKNIDHLEEVKEILSKKEPETWTAG